MQVFNLRRIVKSIEDDITYDLFSVGIFFRIFSRVKSIESVEQKIANKNYDGVTSWLRDFIGIRINLYFEDDIDVIVNYLKIKFQLIEETIDKNGESEFKPTRINLVFSIPEEYLSEFNDTVLDSRIDATFEVQLRTVLSEGWHEIDHDLRYKCIDEWEECDDISRKLNGILAALENNDWAIQNVFKDLAYRHYRNKNISAMIKTKFRIRILNVPMDINLNRLIFNDENLIKGIFKIERADFLNALIKYNYKMPMTLSNMIYLFNYLYLKDSIITSITPRELMDSFNSNSSFM